MRAVGRGLASKAPAGSGGGRVAVFALALALIAGGTAVSARGWVPVPVPGRDGLATAAASWLGRTTAAGSDTATGPVAAPVQTPFEPAPTTAGPPADLPIAGAGSPAAVASTGPGTPAGVPILEYHYVRINPNPRDGLGYRLSVTPTGFGAQMDWLAAHGYHPITLQRLRDHLAGRAALPSRPVILTFDDGYLDFYTTAFPILAAHGFTAVAYVVPGFFGRNRYMSAEEVLALDRAGIEIASHTVDHVDLVKTAPAQRAIELEASRAYLEQLLGHPVLDFCYPYGRFNAAVEKAVESAGYESATTELAGQYQSGADRLAWGRIRVMGGEPLAVFTRSLGFAGAVIPVSGTEHLRPALLRTVLPP